uniref:NTR domain-containing protein n=1 Tax=Plectus sambesii TaxID=2011161 RepID=A0A914VWT6_9BILA
MCKADYVSMVLVKSGPTAAGKFDVTYEIEVQETFLVGFSLFVACLINYLCVFHTRDENSVNVTTLATPSSKAACGMLADLQSDADANMFLVAGKFDNDGIVHLNFCTSVVLPWRKVDPEDRLVLESGEFHHFCSTNFENTE